jgi:phosphatidylserine/phosphatidylglycerophosphate/cardiolipin synthase-like enzyme
MAAADIRALAVALRSGRLTRPFSIMGVQRVLGVHVPGSLPDWLNQVEQAGCSPGALALWFDAVADVEDSRLAERNSLQLVMTAPTSVAGFHRDTAVVVQDLFRRARHSIVMTTYGIFGGKELFRDLGLKMNADSNLLVRVFVHAGQKAAAELLRTFREDHWPDNCRLPEVYHDVSAVGRDASNSGVLHAKCVLIDSEELFVTSANFTDAAHYRNIEAGLLVRSPVVAGQAARFFGSLAESEFCVRLI